MDAQISDVIVTLDPRWENKLDDAVTQLKTAGMDVYSVDEENSVVEGSINCGRIGDLQKLGPVKYIRTVFTYCADFPPGDPRDTDGQ